MSSGRQTDVRAFRSSLPSQHWIPTLCESQEVKGRRMPEKKIMDKLSIYIPQKQLAERPVERLIKLGEKEDRSINYLVVQAILEYLQREERKG